MGPYQLTPLTGIFLAFWEACWSIHRLSKTGLAQSHPCVSLNGQILNLVPLWCLGAQMQVQSFCKDCRGYSSHGGVGWWTPVAVIPNLQIQVVVRSEETRTGPEVEPHWPHKNQAQQNLFVFWHQMTDLWGRQGHRWDQIRGLSIGSLLSPISPTHPPTHPPITWGLLEAYPKHGTFYLNF